MKSAYRSVLPASSSFFSAPAAASVSGGVEPSVAFLPAASASVAFTFTVAVTFSSYNAHTKKKQEEGRVVRRRFTHSWGGFEPRIFYTERLLLPSGAPGARAWAYAAGARTWPPRRAAAPARPDDNDNGGDREGGGREGGNG